MSYSYTTSETTTFTVTHARHMAAKVATDLKRLQRLYGAPSDTWITEYESELTALMKGGYVETVTYGYRRDGGWIEPTLRYTARDLAGGTSCDDDPGRIRPGADITGASFYSYLTYSWRWSTLTSTEKTTVQQGLPFQRGDANEPVVHGYLSDDRTYSAGGRALNRATVRSF